MRFVPFVAAVCVLLWASVEARGQPGRYIPLPTPSGGGGVPEILPHIPFVPSIGGDVCWVIGAIAVVIVVAAVGWNVGQALGGGTSSPPPNAGQSMPPPTIPPLQDLIIQPDEVADKARKTTRLLEALAQGDDAFSHGELRATFTATFTRLQQCWEARDNGPVRELLGPSLLSEHEAQLRAMRRDHVINRSDDVRLLRLEFVHVCCPPEADRHEVTALITWEAKCYFVNDRTGAFLRGSQKVIPYQEFWIFRRYDNGWRLQTIDRSHASDRLQAANRVDGMTEVDRRNAENGVIVL
jgi:hypothetical protein